MNLEQNFDAAFATSLALKEKQIQQNYRPIIGIHKWFARRPGTIFRNLLLAEFNGEEPIAKGYWHGHSFSGVIADPFMGGGTPIYEANRLGFHVVGTDINPMAYWVVRQGLSALDPDEFERLASEVVADVEKEVGELFRTKCLVCSKDAEAKYFMWVKTADCPSCSTTNDLFPGYLLAENKRHPKNVLVCKACGHLNECGTIPSLDEPTTCTGCGGSVHVESTVNKQQVDCRSCQTRFSFSANGEHRPPKHRMWAIEYNCSACKPTHVGRFFKRPDEDDLARVRKASADLRRKRGLPIPQDEIPPGDETDRLHRWGYRFYREMFADRQLLGLGLLLRRIQKIKQHEVRHALLTVFSDFLRYQNLLCRYDTFALKCQDIFSVHGFPVGLVQCENNLLGIPRVGSGSYRHFIEKYARAKTYCRAPFETLAVGGGKRAVRVRGESIEARITERFPTGAKRQAYLRAAPATTSKLPPASLDGVFTDPPYFDNVQYAELMDFCFAWLRLGLQDEFSEFRKATTRSASELTGNVTMGRGLDHFTEGLSKVFQHYAAALKPGAPFVFTYHHNDPVAYLPLVVAILDAGLDCTATLPAAAEMSASLHISGTGSSVLDSVFVCRSYRPKSRGRTRPTIALAQVLSADTTKMRAGGLRITTGDLRCLAAGHLARLAINELRPGWDCSLGLQTRMSMAEGVLKRITREADLAPVITNLLTAEAERVVQPQETAWLPGF